MMPGGGGFESMMLRRRRGRRQPSTVADSGLTGPVEIPDPAPGDQPNDWKSRYQRLRASVAGTARALPRVFRLSWQTSRPLTVTLVVVTVVSGLVPTATAYVAKILMDAVVEAIQIHASGRPDAAVLHIPLLGGFTTTSTGKIVGIAAFQLVVFILQSITTMLTTVSQQLLQERMTLTIRHQVMDHASKMHLAFFEDSASYDLLRQADREAPMRPMSMMSSALGLGRMAITFTSMIALLIAVSPLLAIVALLAPVPLFISQSKYGAQTFILNYMVSPIRRRMDYLSSLVTTDSYAKEVKLFGLGPYLVDRFERLGKVYYDRQRGMIRRKNVAGTLWGLISTVAGSAIYLYIALRAVSGELTLGDLALYTAAATSVQSSIGGLFNGFSGMYENNLYLDTLYRFLGTKPEIDRPENPAAVPEPLRGHITFDHVSFAYPGAEEPALKDVSFDIQPGETVAVVGKNGAGKSTLIKLLCRLYDPTDGRILLDGVDIRTLDPDELQRRISAVFQDHVSYQATASENIGLGDLEHLTDRPSIARAADRAGIANRIERLPRGYDSPLGRWFDEGVSLSGGEWQKIALARAFLREAPILVLDEPTSALDAQAEHDLFVRLRQLAEGRTTLYISHRFSTVRQADRIILLEHGKLVEQGTHADLMDLDGGYAELFTLQASAYLDA
ncbi:ABC transporter ATP-binding protein [Kibdelosporangium persicum]|uniref:ABC-type multidrug transport system, ATPase and permease component n=1 Tax=Kibdelosporangium persicum TaxID=2698649 RepID=A0ABX2FCI7_9PSEU|nr:ABC transporter ATP-binding protein [Kibdelosporangium persicum]NRN68864.1 ABC-type multidrug transport system, ATPase and permease component [Kibdelosporangium persicum]